MRQKQESKRGELSKQELAEIQPHIIRRPELKEMGCDNCSGTGKLLIAAPLTAALVTRWQHFLAIFTG